MNKTIYVIYDADGGSADPVLGVFDDLELANDAIEVWVERELEACFAVDPAESGLDRELDKDWLRKEIRNSVKIKEFDGYCMKG